MPSTIASSANFDLWIAAASPGLAAEAQAVRRLDYYLR
jgi:hypothetical protein